jgi:hypothetical protein
MTSIIVAAIAAFAFGWIWYGPLFGKPWMKMMGITREQIAESQKKSMAVPVILGLIMALITAWAVSYLLPVIAALSFGEFFKVIFVIWLGFTLPIQMGGYLWERKSLKLVVFNMVQNVLSILIISAIIWNW